MIKQILIFLALALPPPLSAKEITAESFFFCQHKKATAVEARTVRIHQFPEKNKCAVIYSVKGRDQVISKGRWLSFCEKKAEQTAANLQKGLWKCDRQDKQVQVFYSAPHQPDEEDKGILADDFKQR